MRTATFSRRHCVGVILLSSMVFTLFGETPLVVSAPREEAVILTPKPPATPRINGARIFGVRPGHPFLFTIPATGQRPMTFAVDDLPEGLKVDPQTGRITGSIKERGEYVVVFRAKNALGQAERQFKIVCGDTLALTPPMGWNSWYIWEQWVSDKVMRDAADAMVSTGMINHGWTYVNSDDGWAVCMGLNRPTFAYPPHTSQGAQLYSDNDIKALNDYFYRKGMRDRQGNVNPGKHFPDMKALTDYIHSKGLKAGIYSGPGPLTCGGRAGAYAGAYQHEEQYARRFAEWGFDFLKYDYCEYHHIAPDRYELAARQKPYRKMGGILQKLDRDIVFNLCQYGVGDVWKWGAEVGGHSWRTAGDLGATFEGIPATMFREVFDLYGRNELQKYCGPGAWNDPDYLMLGYLSHGNWATAPGKGAIAPTPFSPNEQYTHVSLWCLLAAPLILSGDITRLDDFTLSLLTNDEVIEVDQDPLGRSALRVAKQGDLEVWAKDMEDGSKAVGLFNRGEGEPEVTAKWSDLGLSGKQIVRDLWRQKDIGTFDKQFSAPVGRHGVVLVRIRPANANPRPSVAPEAEKGFTPIFNGKDLTGWQGEPGYWSVEDGAITGVTTAEEPLDHPTYLFWRGGKPADFVLRASYRFVTPAGNSGINFRSRELPNWDIKGYQADMETGPNYSGIFYECNQRAIMAQRGQKVEIDEDGKRTVTSFADPAELQKHIKTDGWNEYEIIARGPEIILKINGVATSHVIDRERGKSSAEGLISLQLHPGPPMKVQFKNIRVKSL
ncbi:MAG: DUF1080 domain-containing protein [Planctomycetes bacterium]|nr:DUF1080 domain-containing protein [Planctomycetota bacterium]MCG2684076.1 DUF1080 domain-containing protein [Planctomycetales bacterium]